MKVTRSAAAGTLESSDIMLEIAPRSEGVAVELASTVSNQFGESIRLVILDVVRQMGVDAAAIRATDRGALECTIRARTETVLLRAMGEGGQ